MHQNSHGVILVLCTASPEESDLLTTEIIKSGLAACVNKMPITSYYIWEEESCCNEEHLLFIKTTDNSFESLKKIILSIHSYSTPEIIGFPVTCGFENYLSWVSERCSKKKSV